MFFVCHEKGVFVNFLESDCLPFFVKNTIIRLNVDRDIVNRYPHSIQFMIVHISYDTYIVLSLDHPLGVKRSIQ